mmetsp:Transcript_2664/g.8770  ORF Transcript_2664/g.8770 Transcript_2664/m.8770 type:complete len:284 (-) Transcript_2664:91-942(-)
MAGAQPVVRHIPGAAQARAPHLAGPPLHPAGLHRDLPALPTHLPRRVPQAGHAPRTHLSHEALVRDGAVRLPLHGRRRHLPRGGDQPPLRAPRGRELLRRAARRLRRPHGSHAAAVHDRGPPGGHRGLQRGGAPDAGGHRRGRGPRAGGAAGHGDRPETQPRVLVPAQRRAAVTQRTGPGTRCRMAPRAAPVQVAPVAARHVAPHRCLLSCRTARGQLTGATPGQGRSWAAATQLLLPGAGAQNPTHGARVPRQALFCVPSLFPPFSTRAAPGIFGLFSCRCG